MSPGNVILEYEDTIKEKAPMEEPGYSVHSGA